MTKEFALRQLNRLYREDPWLQALFDGAGVPMDALAEEILAIYNSNWFDTMTAEYVRLYEKKMGITPKSTQTLDDRRSALEARWKSSGKISLALIQTVADSWKSGEVNAAFIGGKIQLTFHSIYGVPPDLDSLLSAVEEVKPAHIALRYILKYLLIRDIHEVLTLSEMNALTLDKFAGGSA